MPSAERVDAGASRQRQASGDGLVPPGRLLEQYGNETESDGARLSRRGNVVVVTVNHRLNIFGHLYLAELGGEEFADSGNAGILDLVLALRWVRDHVAEFGGDANQVTIFGQSGGGAKSATLMAMPIARGLFHRVITMSGQQITASRRSTATRNAERVLAALKLTRERLGELKSMPTAQLVRASRAAEYFGPVKDERSLPRDPFDPDAPRSPADIPLILGNTHGETRTLIGRGEPSIFELTWDTLRPKLEANSPFMGDLDRGEVVAAYRRWYPQYSPADVFSPPPPPRARGVVRQSRLTVAPNSLKAQRRPMCSNSTGAHRSTAASGAPTTGSTCRSCSTTSCSCRKKWAASATRARSPRG